MDGKNHSKRTHNLVRIRHARIRESTTDDQFSVMILLVGTRVRQRLTRCICAPMDRYLGT